MNIVTKDGLEHFWSKLKERFQDRKLFVVTEDIVSVEKDSTKGVAPYSTSYGYTNITISENSGIEWVDGGVYNFIIDKAMVAASSYRNVRVRIGEQGDWHPVMGWTSTILVGSSYFIKGMTLLFVYKSNVRTEGALHSAYYDSNTTYGYLVNSYTSGSIKIDDNGYGARYSLVFPTTPADETDERWSSLVASSSTATTKKIVTPKSGKFYIDRHPQYVYSANIVAGAASANATYQDYTGMSIHYTANTSSTYVSTVKKLFLYLHNFDVNDLSFEADATIGNICSLDKLSDRFADVDGYVYLYFLGYSTTTWSTLNPNFTQEQRIWRYQPSTGELVPLDKVRFAKAEHEHSQYLTEHQDISGKADTSSLATVATSGNYNDLTNKPTIPSAVTESTVSGWGFTKNTGTYSKPSGGIPKSDLASAVQTSLGKADTALQSYTEKYKGTVVSVNSITPDANGNVDLGKIGGGDGVAVGSIISFAGNGDLPAGFLLCNGASVSKTTYPDLFNAIGYTYGGSGNNFNLPNLVNKFIEGGNSAGASGGEAEHTLTIDEMPTHGHNVKIWNTNNTGQTAKEWNGSGTETQVVGSGGRLGSVSWQSSSFKTAGDDWGFGDPMGATLPVGGGRPHNNLPPYTTMRYIIKAFRGASEDTTDLAITQLANELNSLTSLPCNGSVSNTKLIFNNGTELWVE